MALISAVMPGGIRARIDRWIERHSPASADGILLYNRRLYILPTRFGYLFAVMLLLLFLAAINYQNSMAFVLTFMLTALGIVSLWYTHKNLLNITVELKTPVPVFVGESCDFIFTLSHPNISTRYAIGLQYDRQTPVYITLPPQGKAQAQLSIPTSHRGQFKPRGITVFTRYPTGLFHAWGWLKFDLPITIYPKPASGIYLQQTLAEQYHGKAATSTIEGDDFAGLREHREGESLRHISWKAYAQGKGLLTKTFQGHAQPSLWIDFSLINRESVEDRLSCMTAMVLLAEKDNLEYGIKLPGIVIEQQTGIAHRQTCLATLATFQQSDIDSEFIAGHEDSK
ncbi:MAG: DUF58 domain-containing protein [Gammaproteobacteria bacterium]|nr:DUF58 domain-containing protein [Gammaproteobacteria bacterium]